MIRFWTRGEVGEEKERFGETRERWNGWWRRERRKRVRGGWGGMGYFLLLLLLATCYLLPARNEEFYSEERTAPEQGWCCPQCHLHLKR